MSAGEVVRRGLTCQLFLVSETLEVLQPNDA